MEADFADAVLRHKANLKNLCRVNLRLLSPRFTGKSALAILRSCTNLEFFGNLLYFSITGEEKVKNGSSIEEFVSFRYGSDIVSVRSLKVKLYSLVPTTEF